MQAGGDGDAENDEDQQRRDDEQPRDRPLPGDDRRLIPRSFEHRHGPATYKALPELKLAAPALPAARTATSLPTEARI